jgi:hypothetical protein
MFTWILAGSLVVGAPALRDERRPVAPPAGEWGVDRMESDGDRITLCTRMSYRFTRTERQVNYFLVRPVRVAERAAYAATRGGWAEADLPADPAGPPGDRKAIWRVDGDTLTWCEGPPGGARPTDFTAPKGSGRTLTVLKRAGD